MSLTRLVIAHRPETIAGAQRVVRLKQGQVVEESRAGRAAAGETETAA
jgi:ATP-binding cassette subfamily B protein RaxB